MRRVLYLLFGAAVLGGATFADMRGLTLSRARQQRVAPRSVRENPGAYRPVYGTAGRSVRYRGGK